MWNNDESYELKGVSPQFPIEKLAIQFYNRNVKWFPFLYMGSGTHNTCL